MSNPYAIWFEGLRAEYAEQLKDMPLPEGLPEHLRQLMDSGDDDAILFMLKIAWQLGAQTGYSAGQQVANGQAKVVTPSRVQA